MLCFTLYLRAISKYKPPGGLYLEDRFNGGFFAYEFERLIHGGAYFRNFMVLWFKSLFLIVLSTVISFYLVVGALGVMFEYGIGVRPDRQAAFECLKEAAARGNVYAQGNLAVLYFRRKLLNKAADVAKRY